MPRDRAEYQQLRAGAGELVAGRRYTHKSDHLTSDFTDDAKKEAKHFLKEFSLNTGQWKRLKRVKNSVSVI